MTFGADTPGGAVVAMVEAVPVGPCRFFRLFGHAPVSGELFFFQLDPDRDPGPLDNAWLLARALDRKRNTETAVIPRRFVNRTNGPAVRSATLARRERWNDRPF